MKHLSRRYRLCVFGVGLLMASSAASASVFSMKAVRVNGTALPSPTASVDVQRGDLVEVDFMAREWAGEINTVMTYQVTFDPETMINQEGPVACGSIKPFNYDDLSLRLTGVFINTVAVDRGVCAPGSSDPGASCVAVPWPCVQNGGVCIEGLCIGGTYGGFLCATDDNQCVGGDCVERTDFIMFGIPNAVCAASIFGGYRFGCTLVSDPGLPDRGGDYYLGTVLFEVGAEAEGTFTLDILLDPASFLAGANHVSAPMTTEPLTFILDIPCTDPGACCMAFGDCQVTFEHLCERGGGRVPRRAYHLRRIA